MKTRENIRKTKEDESKAEYFDKFMEQVVDVATLDYPNVLVDQYLQDRLKRVEDDFKNQMGIGLEQYFMITGQSQEEFMESQREIAEKQLTMDFVMTGFGGGLTWASLVLQWDAVQAEYSRVMDARRRFIYRYAVTRRRVLRAWRRVVHLLSGSRATPLDTIRRRFDDDDGDF